LKIKPGSRTSRLHSAKVTGRNSWPTLKNSWTGVAAFSPLIPARPAHQAQADSFRGVQERSGILIHPNTSTLVVLEMCWRGSANRIQTAVRAGIGAPVAGGRKGCGKPQAKVRVCLKRSGSCSGVFRARINPLLIGGFRWLRDHIAPQMLGILHETLNIVDATILTGFGENNVAV